MSAGGRKPGPRAGATAADRRFRAGLPRQRIRPTVASVLTDIVAVAKLEIDRIAATQRKGVALTGSDINKLESLVRALDAAQRTEERVLESIQGELADMDDAELEDLADGKEPS